MVGNKIKELRIQRDISRTELAEALNVTVATISNWEIGKTNPKYTELETLSKIFHVSTDYLLGINTSTEKDLKDMLINFGILQPNDELNMDELKLAINSYKAYKNEIKKHQNDTF